jgi:hypothetical protein
MPYWELRIALYSATAPRSSIREFGPDHQAIGSMLRVMSSNRDPDIAAIGKRLMLQYLVFDEAHWRKIDCDLLLERLDSLFGLEKAVEKADEAVAISDHLRNCFLQWDLCATRTRAKPLRTRPPKPPPGTVELDALLDLLTFRASGLAEDLVAAHIASHSNALIALRKRLVPRLEAHGVDPFQVDADGITFVDLCLSVLEIAQPTGSIEEISECAVNLAMNIGGWHEDTYVHVLQRTKTGSLEPAATYQNRNGGLNWSAVSADDSSTGQDSWDDVELSSELSRVPNLVGPLLRRAGLNINQTLTEAQQALSSAEKGIFGGRATALNGNIAHILLRKASSCGSVRYALRAFLLLLPADRSALLAVEVLVIAFIQVLREVNVKPDYFYTALRRKPSNAAEELLYSREPNAQEAVLLEAALMVLTPATETEPGSISEATGAGVAPNFDPTAESPFRKAWLMLVENHTGVKRELLLVQHKKALRRVFFMDGLHPERFHDELRKIDEETIVRITRCAKRVGVKRESPLSIWPWHEDVKKLPLARKVCDKYKKQFPLDDDEGGLAILTSMSESELEVLLTEYPRRVESVEEGGVLERYHLLKTIEDSSLGSDEGIRNLAEDLPIETLREIVQAPVIAMAVEEYKAGMLYLLGPAITVAGREKGYLPAAAAFQAEVLEAMSKEQLRPMVLALHRDPTGRESLDRFERELNPRLVRIAFMELHKPALSKVLEHALPVTQILSVLVEVEDHHALASTIASLRNGANPRLAVTQLLESNAGSKALRRAALRLLEGSDALDETAADGVMKILKKGVDHWGDGLLALARSEARITRAIETNRKDPSHPSWVKTCVNLVKSVSNRTDDVRAVIFFVSDEDRSQLLSELTVCVLQKLVTTCNASKDPEKAGQSVAKALVRLAEEKQEISERPGYVFKNIELHSRVLLARIGNMLEHSLQRRNVSVDKLLQVFSSYSHDELVELERELKFGNRDLVRRTLMALLQTKKAEEHSGTSESAKKSVGELLIEKSIHAVDVVENTVHVVEGMVFGDDGSEENIRDAEKFISDEDAGTLVDAFERVLDEGILDEEELVAFAHDLTPQATLALLKTARPDTFCQKFVREILGCHRRDNLGLEEDSAVRLVAACAQIPTFRVIEVCEVVAQEQAKGKEQLRRLTGIMERTDLFVSNKGYISEDHLLIARNYLMLMLEMRTLSAQAVHSVVKDLPAGELKLWLKDLYGKDAIDLSRDEDGVDGERLFGLFRRRQPGQSLLRALYNSFEDCFPIWLIGIYTIWPIITERMLYVLKCTVLTTEDGTTGLFWDYDFNVECFKDAHAPAWQIAAAGVLIWSLGSIVFLVYKIKSTGAESRFNETNMRRFGYFYQGFEPQFWYWEIGWKRFDFLLVSIITYTALVPDGRAKIIIYVMLAGVAMSAHMFCQPYDERMHGLLDRSESLALLVRFTTFGTVAILLLAGGSLRTIFAFMMLVVFLNLTYLLYISAHILSEMTKGVFTPNVDDADGDLELKEKLEAAKKNMTLGRRILLTLLSPSLVAFHRQRALGEKHAVRLVWQGPLRNLRFGKLPPPQQGVLANCLRKVIMILFSLSDESEMSLISRNCLSFWEYMMGMPSEVPVHGMDILIVLVLANRYILEAGDETSGANLIAQAEKILKDWLDKNTDKAGRCESADAIPPRTVFIHGINLDESVSSEEVVRFLVTFWRLSYDIALYVVHTLDVRFKQLNTHQVLPDEQIVLKAFQTAVEKQRERGAHVGMRYLESTGGAKDTSIWIQPLLNPHIPSGFSIGQSPAISPAGLLDEIDLQFDPGRAQPDGADGGSVLGHFSSAITQPVTALCGGGIINTFIPDEAGYKGCLGDSYVVEPSPALPVTGTSRRTEDRKFEV